MNRSPARRPVWLIPFAGIAIVFGLASLASSGAVLFGPPQTAEAAGETVGFVLWFNFLTAPAYVAAGAAMLVRHRLGARLSALLAGAILAVALAFAGHVLLGGAYEMRTVAALALRAAFWSLVAALACHRFGCLPGIHASKNLPATGD